MRECLLFENAISLSVLPALALGMHIVILASDIFLICDLFSCLLFLSSKDLAVVVFVIGHRFFY